HRQCDALECFPAAFNLRQRVDTIWDFDVVYTAPAWGYADVDEYYRKSSSRQFLEKIKVPTTLLCALDDPFVPADTFKSVRMNLAIDLVLPEKGGHMGYICSKPTPYNDFRWMDFNIVDWVRKRL
ncbi:MAG: hypothetical protein COV67_10405, partial [Nitrospinae bacterium CG11_big_fil_rev_8_21_14_0_20_56_8]